MSVLLRVLLTIGLCAVASVEAARYPFDHFTSAHGLPQSQVLSLHQDRRGEIWVGTWCGAARFDGADFRYLTGRRGLPSNYVRDIAEAPNGDLWFAVGNGVARIALGPQATVAEVHDDVAGATPVRDVHVDRDGVLWAATKSGGLVRIEDGELTTIPTPEIDTDAFQVLAEDAAGQLHVATLEGLLLVRADGIEPYSGATGPWSEPLQMAASDADGRILFATARQVHRIDRGAVTRLPTKSGGAIARARAALEDRSGTLWIATDSGLYRDDDGSGFVRLGLEQGLVNERFYSILEDREGNLWFGHDAGASRFAGEAFRTYLAEDGLIDDRVWSLAWSEDGRLLVGTADGAAIQASDRFRPLPRPNPLVGETIRAIVVDSTGATWFGTRNSGIYRRDGSHWREFGPADLPDPRVFSGHLDDDGSVWFGTRNGLVRFVGNAIDSWTEKDGLPSGTVWAITRDRERRLIVATDDGLAVLADDRFVVPPEFDRFRGVTVRNLVDQGEDGPLWVGTNGDGLHRLEGGEWTALYAGDGPSDDFVWGLIEDPRGRLWVATNHGIDIFDGSTWVNFSRRDGLLSDEIAVNCALPASDSSVWFGFGGPAGLVHFSADPLGGSGLPPIVRVSSVSTRDQSWSEPERIELDWNEPHVDFAFIGVSFRDHRRVSYRTRLVGHDAEVEESRRSRRRYTNLPPGSYTFEVAAASATGVWSPEPARVEVVVGSPPWQTWWFQVATAAALLGLAWLVLRLRLRRLTREKERLARLVDERTADLQEQIATTEKLKLKYQALSVTDSLTGLSNRRFFHEQIEREIIRARRGGEAIGLMVIDLDHFKSINDEFGHQAGDAALIAFARRIGDWVRRTDLLARWGGEEFILAFLNADRGGCLKRAEELRAYIADQPISLGDRTIEITFSAGVIWHDFGNESREWTFDQLVRLADEALYEAKGKGRNRIEVATNDLA